MDYPEVELYVATLREVQRQATQLSSGSGAASDSNDWVVLESQSTPAQLPGEAGCQLWPQQQWQIAYEILFCQCPASVARLRTHQADDMLFFVYGDEAAAANSARLTVRRRQSKQRALPADLQGPVDAPRRSAGGAPANSKAPLVDWRASVLLMVVLQSAYRLSVVTAEDAELLTAFVDGVAAAGGGSGPPPIPGVHHVTQVVHASPSHVPVNLDNSRSDAGRPRTSYPDICFAVDSCDHAFHSELLRLPNDCFCVLLHADMARSWRLPAPRQPGSGEASPDSAAEQLAGLTLALQSSEREAGSGPADASPSGNAGGISSGSSSSRPWHSARSEGGEEAALAFSGYVSHQQLTAALGGQLAGDPLLKVLRAAATAARGGPAGQPLATCCVTMKGPAGRGFADVAVASFPPDGSAAPAGSDEQQQQQHASAGAGRPNLLQRAQLLARGVKAAAQQVAGPRGGAVGAVAVEQLHLRCGLMTLQLPVDMLAQSILQALHLA